MFGAIIRAATTFVAGMLLGSIFKKGINELLPLIKNGIGGVGGLGSNSIVVTALSATENNFALFVFVSVLLGLIVRALVERQLGAAGGRL